MKARTASRQTQSAEAVSKRRATATFAKVNRYKTASSTINRHGKKDVEEHSESEESVASNGSSDTNKDPFKVYCLDFHGKSLSDITVIRKFPKCKTADFSCNRIKKIESLDQNSEIHELKLYSNDLTSIEGLGKLRRLQNLQLQHNQIKAIGDGLKGLRNLKFLNLASNKLTKIIGQEMAHCSNLTFLDLSYNEICRVEFLSAIPYIEELYLSGNQISRCPDASCCKKLQEIDLANNQLTELGGIKSLPNLSVVKISNNLIKDLTSLCNSRSIQRIDVSRNKISKLLHISEQFPNIEVIDLAQNMLSDLEELLHLKQLKELIELNLDGNIMKENFETSSHALWIHKVHEILPKLELLDGHNLGVVHQKPGERHIMRPMTASQGLSTKMVNDQLNLMSRELSVYESMITSRFVAMNSFLDSLPSSSDAELHKKLSESGASSSGSGQKEEKKTHATPDARPASRCGSRARIKAALEFASHNVEK